MQVDLNASSIVCDPDVARAIRLPQKQYHKLYKALAPFCRASGRQSQDTEGGAEGGDGGSVRGSSGGGGGRGGGGGGGGGGSGRGRRMATAFSMAPPPDMALETPAGSLAEMSEGEVAAAVSRIKAGFLRFFVSMMVRYQEPARRALAISPHLSPSLPLISLPGAPRRAVLHHQAARRRRLLRRAPLAGLRSGLSPRISPCISHASPMYLPVSPRISPYLPMYLPVSGSTGGPGALEAEHVFFYPN